MEDLYSIHPGIARSDSAAVGTMSQPSHSDSRPFHADAPSAAALHRKVHGSERVPRELLGASTSSPPRFPALVSAYIDCRKVGAPPEVASLLEEIRRDNYPIAACSEVGADPELDEFMESYCQVLHRFKEDLSEPFDEAASFLSSIEMQLRGLSTEEPDATESQESGPRMGDQELKEMLLRKYSAYLSSLKKEFLKKRKKGKLPKDARMELMAWWKTHYRWPYPTEEEKAMLAEVTGLDQKQINNWFINQRKRHWKPSEDMRSALLEGVAGGSGGNAVLYLDTRTIDP
ncbi:unnamed protein product [Spirodela intermedia]|uniref:Uncharacterized protein n=1 Tax=Spirodela intermedia TaxID=51605 RepID=A0A7I8I9R1_SPIIN|nr:unnamed protein product [Spirodela intermedia]CAA6654405.1 unnamed protein product [Spirodela intermedia]